MKDAHAILTADGSFQTLLALLQTAGLTDALFDIASDPSAGLRGRIG